MDENMPAETLVMSSPLQQHLTEFCNEISMMSCLKHDIIDSM